MIDEKKIRKAEDSVLEYKNRIEDFLGRYLDEKISDLKKVHFLGEEAGKFIKDFICSGGKRLRAAFTYYGYHAAGGGDIENILFASAGMEILHNFFLIHDDIIDKSDLRRNEPTIHKRYELYYEHKGLISDLPVQDKTHLASSMAIIVGDICCALAYEALIDSGFDENNILTGLKMMHEIVKVTAVGEMLDIVKPIEKSATEEEILQIHLLKTAKYTVECPLLLGAILQGTTQDILNSLSKYAIPVGIAFQIRDDILGIFGTEEKLGKPIGSDIEEGKQTLLTVKALEKASPAQKEKLTSLIGKSRVDISDMEDVKRIVEETGALKYSEERIISLSEEGKGALRNTPIRRDTKDILLGLADAMVWRDY